MLFNCQYCIDTADNHSANQSARFKLQLTMVTLVLSLQF
jgi:hypothetical protein